MYRTVCGRMVFSLFHKKTSYEEDSRNDGFQNAREEFKSLSALCVCYTHIHTCDTQSQIIMHPKAKLKILQSADKPNEFTRQNSSQASKMKLLCRVTYVLIQLKKKPVLHQGAVDSCGSWEKAESQRRIPANIQIGSLAEWTQHSFIPQFYWAPLTYQAQP